MVFCSLDALKKSSKKKEARIKKKIITSKCYSKLVTVERNQDDEILGFDLGFVG